MRDRVSPTATNNQVISVLRNELTSVANNSFNVLATRIDRFGGGRSQYSKAGSGRANPCGVTRASRNLNGVRNLLQGSANLEFWKTYNVNELSLYFNELISRSNEYAMVQREALAAAEGITTDGAGLEEATSEAATPESDEVDETTPADSITREVGEIIITKMVKRNES